MSCGKIRVAASLNHSPHAATALAIGAAPERPARPGPENRAPRASGVEPPPRKRNNSRVNSNRNGAGDAARATVDEPAAWTQLVAREQLDTLHATAADLRRAGVEALLGGAFAIGGHVGRWRGTKDIDYFLRPRDRDAAVAAMHRAGFTDYHDQLPYDRSWIFRACRGDAIVDLIWTIPNHVTEVDDTWFQSAKPVVIEGRTYAALPIEELIWIKLFVLQRDRCDWPDLINLVRTNAAAIDWERLVGRVGEHEPLLHALLHVVEWLSPEAVAKLPPWTRARFHLGERPQPRGRAVEAQRARLLDSRPWYAATLAPSEQMMP